MGRGPGRNHLGGLGKSFDTLIFGLQGSEQKGKSHYREVA